MAIHEAAVSVQPGQPRQTYGAQGTSVAVQDHPVTELWTGRLEYHSIDQLAIDPEYQRELKADWVRVQAKKGFRPELFGALTVHRRSSGRMFVVDGQQRLSLAGQCGLDEVPCMVFENLNEPKTFVDLQKERTPLTTAQVFKAKLADGDPAALDIRDTVESLGFALNIGGGVRRGLVGRISAIRTIESIYARGGREGLAQTIAFIRDVWDYDPASITHGMLEAVSEFAMQHIPNDWTEAHAYEKLGTFTPQGVMREGKKVRDDAAYKMGWGKCLYLAMLGIMNKRVHERNQIPSKWGRKLER